MAVVVETGEVDVQVRKNGQTEIVRKPTYDAWIEAWTPKDTMLAREVEDKLPYSAWVKAGLFTCAKGLKHFNASHRPDAGRI
jgi:hypothetical protein